MMRIFTKEFWDGRDMEMFIGRMLRAGVVTASIICIIGGLMYMFRDGSSVADYSQFTGLAGGFARFCRYFAWTYDV